jgi:NhaC family Na+:H+ antiporter
VATFDYLPYAFFNLISPLMSVLFAYLNIKIRRFSVEEAPAKDGQKVD